MTFTVSGTSNQVLPYLNANVMSTSPIPCPKQFIAPSMFIWLSVPTTMLPGNASPFSINVCVPIPESTSKTFIPCSFANSLHIC